MDFKQTYKRLLDSNEFKKWKKENKNSYLASFSTIFDSFSNKTEFWTIAFYDPKEDSMTNFVMKEEVSIEKFNEIAKKPNTKVTELKIEKVKIDFETAIEKIKETKKEYYKNQMLTKAFVVLQNIDEKFLWNISFLTGSFQLINFRIDATNNELISHEAMDFTKF
ncbi:MAG: hypothetical protein QW331_02655 [Candidatus Woesearchaeota archaeon]